MQVKAGQLYDDLLNIYQALAIVTNNGPKVRPQQYCRCC